MHFLKESKKYYDKELKGNISNSFKLSIKDLYKTSKNQQLSLCSNCQTVIATDFCLYCGKQTKLEQQPQDKLCRNICFRKAYQQGKKTVQSIILCIDISGSMNLTYFSKYKKINKDLVLRSMGKVNFEILAKIIGENQVVKNFKNIQVALQSGEPLRQIGFSIKRELQRSAQQKQGSFSQPQQPQYISRKQIIQVGIATYLQTVKHNRPQTQITVVYFNSNLQIPVKNFSDREIIPGLEDRTIQDMVELGVHYADKISISPIKDIEDRLNTNMMKTEAGGQTALAPALAFCMGLAKKLKHDLHQIIVVTDGLSNVGFGKTQQSKDLQQSKKVYEQLAQQYAVSNSCVVNVIGFEDCAIGYEVIDEIIKRTNGLPYQISLTDYKEQKIVSDDTINFLNFQMITRFSQSSKQFCYDTKLAVLVSSPSITLHVPSELEKHIIKSSSNYLSLQLGIRSINQSIEIFFRTEFDQLQSQRIKFTVTNQYSRKSKKNYAIREQFIEVKKGNNQQAEKEQCQVLTKELKDKLKFHKMDDQNLQDYAILEKKLQNKNIVNQMDQDVLKKFNDKKKNIEEDFKNTDKLTRDKKMMETRRNQTFKRRQASSDQQGEEAFL